MQQKTLTMTNERDSATQGDTRNTTDLRRYLANLQLEARRLAGITRAIAYLEAFDGCEEGRTTLVYLAADLAKELREKLDCVHIPNGGAA